MIEGLRNRGGWPLQSGHGDDKAVFVDDSSLVRLTGELRSFLAESIATTRRRYLVTRADATVSPVALEAFRNHPVAWAVRAADGALYDAQNGYAVPNLEGLDASPPAEGAVRLPAFASVLEVAEGAWQVEAVVRHRATASLQIGNAADQLLRAFVPQSGDSEPEWLGWGLSEPFLNPWGDGSLTRSLQAQMPSSDAHFAYASNGAAVQVRARRSTHGVSELVRALVPAGAYGTPFVAPTVKAIGAHPAVGTALSGLCEQFNVQLAIVNYVEATGLTTNLGFRVGARRRELPAAMVLGARIVRDLGLNVANLARQHDVEALGLRRAPSLLVRFSGPSNPLAQLHSFALDVGHRRLGEAMLTMCGYDVTSPLKPAFSEEG